MTIQAKALVRLTGIILTLFLFTTIAAKTQAGAGDSGSTESFDINEKSVEIKKAGDYTITGTGVETENTIEVDLKDGGIANIAIEGVNIKTGDYVCPFSIKKGTVNLTLAGDGNVLQAGDYCAALQVAENSVLVITGEETGKLKAIGGYDAAGIGGGSNSPAGSITIAGGNVYATGGVEAAGIGGGMGSTCDFINIAGGNVVAEGGASGAGIGGGMGGLVGSITISGGTVEATGGERAAGIGGGFSSSGGTITISGGKVTTGGNIGDGLAGYHASGEIKGGTIVCKSFTSTLTISGGSVRTDDNSVIKGMAVVKVPHANAKVTSINIGGDSSYGSNDVYTDGEGKLYLFIPQDKSDPVTLTIEGIANPLPASREYDITNGPITITAAGDYAIVGGETQTGNTIEVDLKDDGIANITIEGVDILKSNQKECPFNIIQGTVHLTLSGKDNKLQAGMFCAALQVSTDSELVITEKSTGKLTATGGTSGAGIGGGAVSPVGSITIAGGTVVATGGGRAADIGGGDGGTISSITIEGGTVEATKGSGGVSIGGSNNESKGFITISGGTVMAYTEIGYSGTGSTVTGKISGGTIVCGSITSTFTISGGSVHSKGNNVMNDGKGMAVIKGLPANSKVESITIDKDKTYGLNDVYTDGNGLLYLYIPKDKPVPLSLTMDDQEEYSASYVATSDKYSPFNPGANASLVQKTKDRKPVLFRNQNGGIIEVDGERKDTPTVGSLVKLKIKSNSVLNYNKLEGISKEDLNVKFTGKVDDTDKGEAEYILTYTISFNMPNHDVCISLFDKLLVEKSKDGEYKVALNKLTIKKPGEYTLKGAYAFLSDEEKKEINPSEIGVVFSVAVKDGIGEVTLHLDGVSLMSNALSVPALSCGSGNTVTVVPDGDNYLEGGYNAAGINKGPDAGTLTIEGPGRLEVKGGSNAAGIGGNTGQQAKNITIAGGTIVAGGGDKNIAGIGSGADVSTATNISITGGSVNATVEGITNKQTAVTFPAMPGAKVIETSGLGSYGLTSMNLYPKDSPSTATLYLWLPSGDTDKEITINGYSGKVTAGNSATLEVITIDTNKPYDPDTHKDKSITIAPDVTFTINAPEASVIDLTIEPGGKLLIDQKLEVQGTFAVQRNVTNKWTTFCSPVDLTLLNGKWANDPLEDDCLYLKSGYTSANDQKWTLQQSIKAYTSYLLASDAQSASSPTTFYTQRVTLQGKEKIDTMNPSDFDNNLLFRANTSLTEQTLKDIYVLDVSSQKLILHTKDYPLQPFEAFFVASPATMKKFRTFSLGGSSQLPTGIAKVENDNFKIDNSIPGTLTFENQGEPATVTVVNASGEIKFVYTHFTGRKKLYGLSTGVYFIRYDNETSKVIVK